MPQYTSVVTMLVVLFYFFIATRVPLARRKFGVPLPAITGHPDFERRRLPGFFIQSSVCLLLVIGAIVGMAMRFWGE